MSNAYRLVVFDWEGTLADTVGQFIYAIAQAAQQLQLGDVDLREARRLIDLGPVVALKKLFPQQSAHAQAELLQAAQLAMLKNPTEVYLMTGAEALLQQIKQAGIQLAIATNKGQQSFLRDLEASGLQSLFDVTRSASQAPAKPCPQMLEEIMEACHVIPEQTLMVGDSVADIEMAIQAHVQVVGVDFYHQNESSLRTAGAYDVFDDFGQLAKFLDIAQT